jgi:hypothetical protein
VSGSYNLGEPLSNPRTIALFGKTKLQMTIKRKRERERGRLVEGNELREEERRDGTIWNKMCISERRP